MALREKSWTLNRKQKLDLILSFPFCESYIPCVEGKHIHVYLVAKGMTLAGTNKCQPMICVCLFFNCWQVVYPPRENSPQALLFHLGHVPTLVGCEQK